MKKEKIYFASDFHLGIPKLDENHKREKHITKWLTEINKDAKAIYLVGDIFDFWFEYKKVVPKGFVRILGKIAELTDNGTQVHLFVGNHDLWMSDYLKKEIGITIHHEPKIIKEQNKKIFIGHGDGMGKGDYIYKIIKKLFTSKICQWAFARLHPNFAFFIAHKWSNSSRKNNQAIDEKNDILFTYCKEKQKIRPVDYYILGHNHNPVQLKIDKESTYINLGDWITHNTFAVMEKSKIKLKKYSK